MFGVLACLDSWLYIFTILPLRFLKAVGVLVRHWTACIRDYFNYEGNKLRKTRKGSLPMSQEEHEKKGDKRKRREKKVSRLLPSHKADILRGMVLFTSCLFLMRFDASKMYHSIRGQSGIKLYVIYNMLDVSLSLHCRKAKAEGMAVRRPPMRGTWARHLRRSLLQRCPRAASRRPKQDLASFRFLPSCARLQHSALSPPFLPSHYSQCRCQLLLQCTPHPTSVRPIRRD